MKNEQRSVIPGKKNRSAAEVKCSQEKTRGINVRAICHQRFNPPSDKYPPRSSDRSISRVILSPAPHHPKEAPSRLPAFFFFSYLAYSYVVIFVGPPGAIRVMTKLFQADASSATCHFLFTIEFVAINVFYFGGGGEEGVFG